MRRKLEKRSVNALKLLHAFSTDISLDFRLCVSRISYGCNQEFKGKL
jgi:hypothetical protein